jgi:hypothetical protein
MAVPNLATAKRICVGCGGEAHVWDKKWYCGIDFITQHGACQINKKIHNIPTHLMEAEK